jgi:hypothetical protein
MSQRVKAQPREALGSHRKAFFLCDLIDTPGRSSGVLIILKLERNRPLRREPTCDCVRGVGGKATIVVQAPLQR